MKITDKAGFAEASEIRPIYGREAYEAIEKCVDSMTDIKVLFCAPPQNQPSIMRAAVALDQAIDEAFDA